MSFLNIYFLKQEYFSITNNKSFKGLTPAKFFLIIEKLKSNMKKEKGDYCNAIRREVRIFLNFPANLF